MTSPQAVLQALYDAEEQPDPEDALVTPPEGQEIQIAHKGSVIDVLQRIRGHLASAVSYAGAAALADARATVVPEPLRYLIPLSESAYRESYLR
jgi:hypothetical protein